MPKKIQLRIDIEEANNNNCLIAKAAKILNLHQTDIKTIKIIKKSLDARTNRIQYNYILDVFLLNEQYPEENKIIYKQPNTNKKVIIIGSGPAGLFAALKLLEEGIKPIIFERGNNVSIRKQDIAKLTRGISFSTDSNYCYGEGGAGTFSDGKIYTRSNKRGNINKIFNILINHGANPNIAYEAKPHIGSDKLTSIIKNIRKTILNNGGEIHFNAKMTDIITSTDNTVTGIVINHNDKHFANAVIIATGNSAYDVYKILYQKKIQMRPKPSAIGIRVEHHQELINISQYHKKNSPLLPPASYSLSYNYNQRGIYSFCMCPGGYVVPAMTQYGESVTNGMSFSRRNSKYANSAIIVTVSVNDYINHINHITKYNKHNMPFEIENIFPLIGLYYIKSIDSILQLSPFSLPAQKITDFINNKQTTIFPPHSFSGQLISINLNEILPDYIANALKIGFKNFNTKIKGFINNDSIIYGFETHTSSLVTVPRNNDLSCIGFKNLYFAGEGSGYAGGIISSAIDGEQIASAVIKNISN